MVYFISLCVVYDHYKWFFFRTEVLIKDNSSVKLAINLECGYATTKKIFKTGLLLSQWWLKKTFLSTFTVTLHLTWKADLYCAIFNKKSLQQEANILYIHRIELANVHQSTQSKPIAPVQNKSTQLLAEQPIVHSETDQ